MCLYNYNKKRDKYKHITYVERMMIERWYNQEHRSKEEIAKLLNKSDRAIRREINRGLVIIKGYMWEDKEEYSAQIAQEKYEYNKTGKGPVLKLDQDIKLVEHIETQIIEEKKSPEVVSKELKQYGFNIEISGRTIRNGIKPGLVFNKVKQGTTTVLFTLTERLTRREIIVKLPNKKTETIAKALDKIEKKYGSKFYKIFKTITFDNGTEFMGYKGLEKSCRIKKKRTQVYYAHPYRSCERGTNENNNRMIRRWIPKGIDMTNIKESFIKEIEDWINNYPRAMFDYKSSNIIILEQ